MLVEGARMADVSKDGQSQQQSRKGGATPSPPHDKGLSVGERLYSQVHVCNHARCAANDPGYNVKNAVPPKKFLVAKKHVYGRLDDKVEKTATKTVRGTPSTEHQRDRSHALQSLTNSVLATENGKAKSNGLRSAVNSVMQNRRRRDTRSSDRTVAEQKDKSATRSSISAHSGCSGRSSVTTEAHSAAHKSRRSNASSIPFPPATERSEEWEEDPASPDSTVTSLRDTDYISTRRGEEEQVPALPESTVTFPRDTKSDSSRQGEEEQIPASPESTVTSPGDTKFIFTRRGEDQEKEEYVIETAGGASSPTASVGSNHDIEISSLKETGIVVDGGIFEQSTAKLDDFPASETISLSNLQGNFKNKGIHVDPPSPSVDSISPVSVSESSTPSTPSTRVASTDLESSSLTDTSPASEISSSIVQSGAAGEEISYISSTPSVASGPSTSEPLASSVASSKKGSTKRSSRTPSPPSASATRLARKFISNLKESPKAGSLSSVVLGNGSSRLPRNPLSPPLIDSSPAPTNASGSEKKFITSFQANPPRKASTKGVRAIELRGGRAQSYSTTTVTSWNVTTPAVATSVSDPKATSEENVKPGLSADGSVGVFMKLPEQSSLEESQAVAAGSSAPSVNGNSANDARATVKSVKNSVRSFEEVRAESERVSLKHGEVAERRLSEEYMTNHALEGVVKKITDNDHKVKVLVHAFESLATLSDSEVHGTEDDTRNPQSFCKSMSVTTITV